MPHFHKKGFYTYIIYIFKHGNSFLCGRKCLFLTAVIGKQLLNI